MKNIVAQKITRSLRCLSQFSRSFLNVEIQIRQVLEYQSDEQVRKSVADLREA